MVVYGDASGYQQQTTGATDYEMIREYFAVHSNMPVEYRAAEVESERAGADQPDEPATAIGGGEIGLLVDPKCKELIKDFEQVCYKADTNADR